VHTGIEAPSEEIKRCCGNQPAIPAAAKGTRVIPARFRNAYTAQPPKRRNTTPKIQNHKSVPALQITGLAAIAAVMCLPTTKRTISSGNKENDIQTAMQGYSRQKRVRAISQHTENKAESEIKK
jgi:hypothetical protein